MKKITSASAFQREMESLRRKGKTIGFVPTMGALHEGHLSLVRQARNENNIVVVSIFVNPTQFGPKEDFKKYPKTLPRDSRLLQEEKTDYLFCPTAAEMYPEGFSTAVEVSGLSEGLCGPFRPGHFRGVATVVLKLFTLVKPHRVYFGAKDFQQAAVIRKMIQDLNLDIEFRLCATVREQDGLAMSSRNRYLSPEDRLRAVMISQTLFGLREALSQKNANFLKLKKQALQKLRRYVDRIDYLEVVDPMTLTPLVKAQSCMVAAAACFLGKTRLIDNVIIGASSGGQRTKD